jgi:hypothetical protein
MWQRCGTVRIAATSACGLKGFPDGRGRAKMDATGTMVRMRS